MWRLWHEFPGRFPTTDTDAFVVMPNHIHGIIILRDTLETDLGVGLALPAPRLGDIIGAFKSLSAREANRALGRTGPLWQRNYFERIIRNRHELDELRRYIEDNPLKWAFDEENR